VPRPADFRSSSLSSMLKARGAGGISIVRPPGIPFITSLSEADPAGLLRTITFGVSSSDVRAFGRSGLMICPIADGTPAVGETCISLLGRALVAINWPFPLFETMKVQYLSEE